MFTVNGNPILADELDVLIELKDQLALNGIYRFETLRPITNHIQFNCPMHKPLGLLSSFDKWTRVGLLAP